MEDKTKVAEQGHVETPLHHHLNDEEGDARRAIVEKRLKRKLDARFSILVVIYILNYIDRNNASQARLKGFETDLHLKGQQFATTLSIVYVGYILMQIPSNMVLNKITRPSIYIGCAMLIWGMISVLTGITTNFTGVLLTRFFLGFIEAAFLPGALFLLSKWYKRNEIAVRYTILFAGNLISNAFGSLIAAGVLSNMEGVLGHPAWRWLFFIEGALTMFFALIAMVMLPDTPTNSRGFSHEELQVAQLRMLEDTGEADSDDKDQPITYGLKLAVQDYKIYLLSLSLIAVVTGLSFNAYFPTLTKTLGFGTTETLLLSAPPWVFSVILSLLNSWHADKTQEKFFHASWPLVMGMVGFIISIATQNTAARYVALFLQAGSYSGYIIMYTWMSSAFPRPPAKRAVAISLLNAVSQLGNIAGSYVWDKKFGPTYRIPYVIVLVCFAVGIVLNFAFRQVLVKLNKKLEENERAWAEDSEVIERAVETEGVTKDEALQMRRGFRYDY